MSYDDFVRCRIKTCFLILYKKKKEIFGDDVIYREYQHRILFIIYFVTKNNIRNAFCFSPNLNICIFIFAVYV